MSIQFVAPPTMADSSATRADWVEWAVLSAQDRNISVAELSATLDKGDSVDGLIEPAMEEGFDLSGDEGLQVEESVQCEAAADETFDELHARATACGDGGYPFDLSDEALRCRDNTIGSVYVFLLLMSLGEDTTTGTSERGTKLFEEISGAALRNYMDWRHGDDALVDTLVFGFPRRHTKDGFAPALDRLCLALGEGKGHKNRPDTSDQKDAALDVVAWKNFPDDRPGKHIVFGQCATGKNWRGKLLELPDTDRWCGYYLQERPSILPLRAFLVPHIVDDRHWCKACHFGDLVFDRCRIAYCCRHMNADLAGRVATWNETSLRVMAIR